MSKNRKQTKRIREDYNKKGENDMNLEDIQREAKVNKIVEKQLKEFTISEEDIKLGVANKPNDVDKRKEEVKKEIQLAEKRIMEIKERRTTSQREILNLIIFSMDACDKIHDVDVNKHTTRFVSLGKFITCVQSVKPTTVDIQSVTTNYFVNGKPLHILSQYEMNSMADMTSDYYQLSYEDFNNIYVSSYNSFMDYMAKTIKNHKVLTVHGDTTVYDINNFRITMDAEGVIYVDAMPLHLLDMDVMASVFKELHTNLKCNF